MDGVRANKVSDFLSPIILYTSVLFWVLVYIYPNFGAVYYAILFGVSLLFIVLSRGYGNKISFKGILLFGLYMSSVSSLGVIISGNMLHLVQVCVYLFGPVLFFLIGFNSPPDKVCRNMAFVLYSVFILTLLERMEFWAGLNIFNLVDFFTQMKYATIDEYSDPSVGRATGIFINPNQLGFFAGSMMYSIFTLSGKRSRWDVLIFISAASLIFFSGSRGSISALFLSLIAYLLYARSTKVIFGAFISCVAIFYIYYYISSFDSANTDAFISRLLFESGYGGESISGRMFFWSNIFENVNIFIGTLAPPELVLGHAIDSFYMRVLAQGGVVGLLFGIFLLVSQCFAGDSAHQRLSRSGFVGLLIFVALNSVSMLGLLGLEAVFVWAVFGCLARSPSNDRGCDARRAHIRAIAQ